MAVISSDQQRIAWLQVAVAGTVGLGARIAQLSLTVTLEDDASVFAILFDPTFWTGFALFAATYLLIAGAIGWILGVALALAVLAGAETARNHSMAVLLGIPAACSALLTFASLLLA